MTDNEILVKFGARLRALRERRGYSAEKIGEIMGLSSDAVRKYERGDRSLDIVKMVHAKERLNVDFMTMLAGLDEQDSTENLEYNILSARGKSILRKLATVWDGDIEALIIYMGMVASFPPEYQRELYMTGDDMRADLLRRGIISEADLPPGIEYMQSQIGGLYK